MKKEAAKLRRLLFLMIVLAFTTTFLPAQVAINTDGTDPDQQHVDEAGHGGPGGAGDHGAMCPTSP